MRFIHMTNYIKRIRKNRGVNYVIYDEKIVESCC